jgi:CBS domain-containing protein
MNATLSAPSDFLMLRARTAADLMATNPVSLRAEATAAEALRLLTNKGITAAPVIDDAGHPIGVLSRSDLLVHQREVAALAHTDAPYFQDTSLEATAHHNPEAVGMHVPVAELMTPAVFSVAPDTPARRVVEEMLALHVHRMFVVDDGGFLVGVVSAMDVLRHLEPSAT